MSSNARQKRAEVSGEGCFVAGPGRQPDQESTFSRLLEPLLAEAPQLVRRRSLLPAFDWREATSSQVERLLRQLSEAEVNVPVWLAKGLVVAGHRLPASALRNCPPDLMALAALNAAEAGGLTEGQARQVLDSALLGDMEEGVAAPLVERLVVLGHAALACRVALSQAHTSPEAMRRVRDNLAAEIEALPLLRLRLAGTSATHGLAEAMKPAFAGLGKRADISEAAYAAVICELLRPVEPADAMVVLMDREFFSGVCWRRSAAEARRLVDEQLDTLSSAMEAYHRTAGRPLLVNTLPAPVAPTAGHIDRHHATGESCLVTEVNRRLAEIAARVPSVHLVDADVALAAVAPAQRSDPKLWYYGRMAYSEAAQRALAYGFSRVWLAKEKGPAKVLALDFDNTLWGGIFGDDGLHGLQCGDDFPGNAFKALQKECLRLKAQGMLLVGLSKNNPDAIDVFSKHPGMALRSDDFIATAVNWEPKPDNIRRLAAQLGLGLESFVFLDDSPHEREAMRRMCPGVVTPDMPADPSRRPLWLRSLSCTWPLRLTEEDSRRSDMYAAERKGQELRETAGSYGEYLAGLQQRLVVAPVTPETIARAAQLHQRTNQFNLTTRRLTETELSAFMIDGKGTASLVGRVSDRFGDHGIVLAACATISGTAARIETFVMSCRVIGRQLEQAFLDALTDHLAGLGVERVEASYRPTAKNGVVREFYPSMGFVAAGHDGEAEVWVLSNAKGAAPAVRPVTTEWGER